MTPTDGGKYKLNPHNLNYILKSKEYIKEFAANERFRRLKKYV